MMKSFAQVFLLVSLAFGVTSGFCPLASVSKTTLGANLASTTTAQNMVPPELSSALLEPTLATNTLLLAETQAWVQPTASFLDPFLNFLTFAMLARVVLSWYPEAKVTEMPWVLLVVPTQPLLKAARGLIPPA